MTLTTEAKAILYVVGTDTEPPELREVAHPVTLGQHAAAFILEQMKQHNLVIECAGRFTLSREGVSLLNDLS